MKIAPALTQTAIAPNSPEPGKSTRGEQFRQKVRAADPSLKLLHATRIAARAMFGDAAFWQKKGGGSWLSLDAAQLKKLGANADDVEKAIKAAQAKGALPADPKEFSAASAAKRIAHLARASLPPKPTAELTIATVNDDFNTKKTNIPHVKADVLMVQEGEFVDVRKRMSKQVWGVHQERKSLATAGTPLLWKKDKVKSLRGGQSVGVEPHGVRMRTRYITWNDVVVDGVKVRMATVHRPPLRFRHLWPEFDAHLSAFIKKTKLPLVIGMDSNQHGGPAGILSHTNMKWNAPKGSIDGFLTSPGIEIEKMWRLPKGSSDHHPVVAKFRVKGN